MTRAAILAIVAFATIAELAQARDPLAIAAVHWAREAPGAVNPCPAVQVVYTDEMAPHHLGEVRATWTGERYEWGCEVYVRPGLSEWATCNVVVHEVGHLILGPSHDGPMANVAPRECEPTRLEAARESMREELPAPTTWTIACRRSRCIATAPWAKRPRLFRYVYRGPTVEWWPATVERSTAE